MTLKYNDIGKLDLYYRNISLKGGSVIDVAINLVALKKHLDVIEVFKKDLLTKHNEGKQGIDSKHKNWAPFIQDLEPCLLKDVEVKDLKVINLKDIDTSRNNSQEAIAELMKLDLIKTEPLSA